MLLSDMMLQKVGCNGRDKKKKVKIKENKSKRNNKAAKLLVTTLLFFWSSLIGQAKANISVNLLIYHSFQYSVDQIL